MSQISAGQLRDRLTFISRLSSQESDKARLSISGVFDSVSHAHALQDSLPSGAEGQWSLIRSASLTDTRGFKPSKGSKPTHLSSFDCWGMIQFRCGLSRISLTRSLAHDRGAGFGLAIEGASKLPVAEVGLLATAVGLQPDEWARAARAIAAHESLWVEKSPADQVHLSGDRLRVAMPDSSEYAGSVFRRVLRFVSGLPAARVSEVAPHGPLDSIIAITEYAIDQVHFFGHNVGRSLRLRIGAEAVSDEIVSLARQLARPERLELEWEGIQIGDRSVWSTNSLELRFAEGCAEFRAESSSRVLERRMLEEAGVA